MFLMVNASTEILSYYFKLSPNFRCLLQCVCVYEREREREREGEREKLIELCKLQEMQ